MLFEDTKQYVEKCVSGSNETKQDKDNNRKGNKTGTINNTSTNRKGETKLREGGRSVLWTYCPIVRTAKGMQVRSNNYEQNKLTQSVLLSIVWF